MTYSRPAPVPGPATNSRILSGSGGAARTLLAPRTAPSGGGDAKAPVGGPQGAGWVLCGAVAFGFVLGVGVMLRVGDR